MNLSQPRQTFKSEQKNPNQPLLTTCLNTPPKNNQPGEQSSNPLQQKQCPYHFGHPTHICLTCRRSICPRCALTFCNQHSIHPQQQILDILSSDLQKLTIQPHIQDLQLRLKQSKQRQQYLLQKIQKMLTTIQSHFQHTKTMLDKKKQQIIHYFKSQLLYKFIQQYAKYNQQIQSKLLWLKTLTSKYKTIQQLDSLALIIKKSIPTTKTMFKTQLKICNSITGSDKIKLYHIWSQQKLQNILYQIQNIPYKLKQPNLNSSLVHPSKKKRIVTQIQDHSKDTTHDNRIIQFNSNHKNSIIKSGSNSKFHNLKKIDR